MKLGLAARLSWVLAMASGLVAGLTGLYIYRASHNLLVQHAKNELLTSTKVLASRTSSLRRDVARDLNVLAKHPATLVTLTTLKQEQTAAMDQLASLFELLMQSNTSYLQIRLISASENGLERVRVDRDGARTLRVTGDDLQEKGHFPYVHDTLKLGPGKTYLSPIVINHELGAHGGLGRPTAQIATPVIDAQSRTLGVVVINVDLNGTFAAVASDLPEDYQLYLANAQGDFLIHPDPSQAFGFDRGQSILLQNEFPAALPIVTGQASQVVTDVTTGRHADAPVVAVFLANATRSSNDDDSLILGLARPLNRVLAGANQLGTTIVRVVGGFGLLGIALAVLLARFITRPLNALGTAAQRFSEGQEILDLPVHRSDEIGKLAQSFMHMQSQIKQQFDALQRSHLELERLARHDVLTGLPNRRLFIERLEAALERTKRGNAPLALLFIDLDKFKDINDQLGHDAGDAALKAVAQRLLASTRKIDTVARLGGDEFVVLLDSVATHADVAAIAEKLCDSMRAPVAFGTRALSIGLSIGVSIFPQDGDSADQLISSADTAMYQAKADPDHRMRFAGKPLTPA